MEDDVGLCTHACPGCNRMPCSLANRPNGAPRGLGPLNLPGKGRQLRNPFELAARKWLEPYV